MEASRPNKLEAFQLEIEDRLEEIESLLKKRLPDKTYVLTLIATCVDSDGDNSHILLSQATRENVLRVVDQFMPD